MFMRRLWTWRSVRRMILVVICRVLVGLVLLVGLILVILRMFLLVVVCFVVFGCGGDVVRMYLLDRRLILSR